jgi:hypothetical protein
LRFTLSHPVTAAVPPGEAELWKTAIKVADNIQPLSSEEAEKIKEKGLKGIPLFKYSGT